MVEHSAFAPAFAMSKPEHSTFDSAGAGPKVECSGFARGGAGSNFEVQISPKVVRPFRCSPWGEKIPQWNHTTPLPYVMYDQTQTRDPSERSPQCGGGIVFDSVSIRPFMSK